MERGTDAFIIDRKSQRSFHFDCCFDSSDAGSEQYADQESVYQALGRDILENAFKGHDTLIYEIPLIEK